MEIIETNRLILRSPCKKDTNLLLGVLNDEDAMKYIPGFFRTSYEDVLSFIEICETYDYKNHFFYVLEEKASHTIVGVLDATKYETLYISYLCKKSRRREGFVSEALVAFSHYLINNSQYSTLAFIIDENNLASKSLIKKYGVQSIGKIDSYETYYLSLKDLP